MKHIFKILILTLLLTSCGDNKEPVSQSIQDLNARKTVLKTQIDSLSKKLKSVEAQLSKLDTIKKLAIVTSISPKSGVFKHFIEVQGTVKADKNVEIHPEMRGSVTNIYVKEGQKVRKGQTLAQFDASIINNNIAQLKTQLNLAITSFERQERLWNQKIGSEMQYLQAKAQKEGLENNLNALYAQANKMKIIAPFNGTIDEVFGKVGELASPQMPFLRVINLSKVYLESEITETYLKDIKKGTEVVMYFPSLDREITSKITQVGNFINPNNRSFKTRVDINNTSKTIKPNLLADVKIKDFEASGIIIPSNSIQKDQNNNAFVYTLQKTDLVVTVKKTMITVANEYNNESFISEGLKADDLIVDKGAHLVKNEDEVILTQQ